MNNIHAWNEYIVTSAALPGMALLPSGGDGVQKHFSSLSEVNFLSDLIEPLKESFDYIFIDSSPNIDGLTLNIIQASDHILLPDYGALRLSFQLLRDLG